MEPGSKLRSSSVVSVVTGVGALMPSARRTLVPVTWISSTPPTLFCCAVASAGTKVARVAAIARHSLVLELLKLVTFISFPFPDFGIIVVVGWNGICTT